MSQRGRDSKGRQPGSRKKPKGKVSFPNTKGGNAGTPPGFTPTNADFAFDDKTPSGSGIINLTSDIAESWEDLADEDAPPEQDTVSPSESSPEWPPLQASTSGSSDGVSTTESSPRSQPASPQVRPVETSRNKQAWQGSPARTMGGNEMDPSNVLASSQNEIQGGDEKWTLTEFVSYRCQNVIRISANNDSRLENERREMENDLKIYLKYNRGLNALLPSKPGSRPETKETEQPRDNAWQARSTRQSSKSHKGRIPENHDDITCQPETRLKYANYDIFANHFQIDMPGGNVIHVYNVKFGNYQDDNKTAGVKVGTGMWMEYSNKSKWERIVREYGQDPKTLNGVRPVYDGGSYMVANRPFAWPEEELKRGVKLTTRNNSQAAPRVEVTITLRNSVDMDNYKSFLNNDMRCVFPKDLVQVVLTLMRQYCVTKGLIPSERFYFEQMGGQDLDAEGNNRGNNRPGILMGKTGFFQSVRVLGSGLQLNVDAMASAFYKPNIPLIDAWDEMLKRRYLQTEEQQQFENNWKNYSWTPVQATIANRYWKNMQINSLHKGRVIRAPAAWSRDEQYSICKVTSVAASSTQVLGDYAFQGLATNREYTDGGPGQFRGNLINFMHERYYGDSRNANTVFQNSLPAIKVSKSRAHYLPWGCCLTSTASRYPGVLGPHLKIKLDTTPLKRHSEILEWVTNRKEEDDRGIDQRPWAEKLFDVQLSREMIKVKALILDKPFLVMNGAGDRDQRGRNVGRQDQKLSYLENRNSFQILAYHHMLEPSRIVSYVVLSFDRAGRKEPPWENEFISQLGKRMKLRGLTPNIADEYLKPVEWFNYYAVCDRADFLNPGRSPRQKMRDTLNEVFLRYPTLTILICFMTRRMNPEYATLKSYCDITVGVPTQVVIAKPNLSTEPRDLAKMSSSVDNVLWKINVKCGGTNFRVGSMEEIRVMNREKNTILMGADVTHGSPSIAAVVATTDSRAVNYAIRIKAQNPNQERIEHLQGMAGELFEVYHGRTGAWPDHIIFFRDGVSETQFLDTLRFEGTQILQAAEDRFGQNRSLPKLFIVLAVKRHHTRFFKQCTHATRPGQVVGQFENIEDGTVIQDGVTHPREYEFFLCSHRPVGRGTVRPTKYHVLVDQLGIHPEQLYKLIYYLCFSFQRCQRAVALVTPVNYSHFAAFRAKLYMDDYVAEHPKPPAGSTPQEQAEWLAGALRQDLNAHPRLRDRLWFL